MKKQAYLKMMKMAHLNKSAEADYNTLGPILGILGMAYLGNKISKWIHGKDASGWTQAAYMTPAAILGERLGNWGQNVLSGTDNESLAGGLLSNLFAGKTEKKPDKDSGQNPNVNPEDEETVDRGGFSARNKPPEDFPSKYNPWFQVPYHRGDDMVNAELPTEEDIEKSLIRAGERFK